MTDPATRLADLEREIRAIAMQVFGEVGEFAVDDVRKMGLLLNEVVWVKRVDVPEP